MTKDELDDVLGTIADLASDGAKQVRREEWDAVSKTLEEIRVTVQLAEDGLDEGIEVEE